MDSTFSPKLLLLGGGSQKFPAKNPRSISSILTFRDLHSHICRIFMRMAGWENRVLMKSPKQCCQNVKKIVYPKNKKLPGMCPEGPEGSKIGSVLFLARHGMEKSDTDRVGSGPARTGTEHPWNKQNTFMTAPCYTYTPARPLSCFMLHAISKRQILRAMFPMELMRVN